EQARAVVAGSSTFGFSQAGYVVDGTFLKLGSLRDLLRARSLGPCAAGYLDADLAHGAKPAKVDQLRRHRPGAERQRAVRFRERFPHGATDPHAGRACVAGLLSRSTDHETQALHRAAD